jgi:hypothetical protein
VRLGYFPVVLPWTMPTITTNVIANTALAITSTTIHLISFISDLTSPPDER